MADPMIDHVEADNPDIHHEESDINVRAVLIGIVIFLGLAVIMHVGLWGLYVGFRKIDRSLDPPPATALERPVTTDGNEFTAHWWEPAKYLEEIREGDRKILDEYGWVNRSAGQVHVPIEVGMDMALERGYPTRSAASSMTGGEAAPHQPWEMHLTREPAEAGGAAAPAAAPGTDEPAVQGAEASGGHR